MERVVGHRGTQAGGPRRQPLLRLPLMVMLAAAVGFPGRGAAQEPSGLPPWDVMVDTILAGIEHNRENLGLVKFTVTTTIANPALRSDGTVRETLPDGLVLEHSNARQSRSQAQLYLLDNRVREEQLDGAARVLFVKVFDGKTWTSHDPKGKSASIERPERLGGRLPPDPVEAMALQHSMRTLAQVLRESDFIGASAVPSPHGGTVWQARLMVPGLVTLQHEFEFDPARSFLPVRSRAFHDDGSLYLSAEAGYRHEPQRDAWVPQSVSQKVFSPGRARRDSDPGWNSRIVVGLENVEFLEAADAERLFALALPPGTAVRDTVEERNYRMGGENLRPVGWPRFLWIAAAVLVAVIVVVFSRYLRSAWRPSS